MIGPRHLNQPIEIQRATTTRNSLNNQVKAWTKLADVCGFIEQKSTTEQVDDRDVVVTTMQAMLPPGVDVKAHDRIKSGGQLWEVDGDPVRFWNPRVAAFSHQTVKLIGTTAGG